MADSRPYPPFQAGDDRAHRTIPQRCEEGGVMKNGASASQPYYVLNIRAKNKVGDSIVLPLDKRCQAVAQGRALVVIVGDETQKPGEPRTVQPSAEDFLRIESLATELMQEATHGNPKSYADVRKEKNELVPEGEVGKWIGELLVFTLRQLDNGHWKRGMEYRYPDARAPTVVEIGEHASFDDAAESIRTYIKSKKSYIGNATPLLFTRSSRRKKAFRNFGVSDAAKAFRHGTRLNIVWQEMGKPAYA
jgi:hypothetical protein